MLAGHGDENQEGNPDNLSARLRSLDARLVQATKAREKAEPRGHPRSDAGALGQALQLSAGFISGVAVGGIIGWGVDRLVGSSPWGLIICLLLGFCAGMFTLQRAAAAIKTASLTPNKGTSR
jgi:ATP synthase protein I